MRQDTKVTTVYKASELSEKAQEKAREWFVSCWDWSDTEMVTESLQESLTDAGLPGLDLEWSLSYCQGDGVAFYGRIDLDALIALPTFAEYAEEVKRLDAEGDLLIEIVRNSYGHHYSHRNTMNVSIESNSESKTLTALEEDLSQYIKDVSRQLEREGYEMIESMQSMETFLDTAEANDWEFTADGKIY